MADEWNTAHALLQRARYQGKAEALPRMSLKELHPYDKEKEGSFRLTHILHQGNHGYIRSWKRIPGSHVPQDASGLARPVLLQGGHRCRVASTDEQVERGVFRLCAQGRQHVFIIEAFSCLWRSVPVSRRHGQSRPGRDQGVCSRQARPPGRPSRPSPPFGVARGSWPERLVRRPRWLGSWRTWRRCSASADESSPRVRDRGGESVTMAPSEARRCGSAAWMQARVEAALMVIASCMCLVLGEEVRSRKEALLMRTSNPPNALHAVRTASAACSGSRKSAWIGGASRRGGLRPWPRPSTFPRGWCAPACRESGQAGRFAPWSRTRRHDTGARRADPTRGAGDEDSHVGKNLFFTHRWPRTVRSALPYRPSNACRDALRTRLLRSVPGSAPDPAAHLPGLPLSRRVERGGGGRHSGKAFPIGAARVGR